MKRAQGSLEYLLIFAAVLAIAVVIVLVANSLLGSPQEATEVQQDKYSFAVNGFEVNGYDKPINVNDPTTFPNSLNKQDTIYIYAPPAIDEELTPIGSLTDETGGNRPVYTYENSTGNYYHVKDSAPTPTPPEPECTSDGDCEVDYACINQICHEEVSGCTSYLGKQNHHYTLASPSTCFGTGVMFMSSAINTTLNCNGKSFSGTGTWPNFGGTGIIIDNGAKNLTIDNCKFLLIGTGINAGFATSTDIIIKNSLFASYRITGMRGVGDNYIIKDTQFSGGLPGVQYSLKADAGASKWKIIDNTIGGVTVGLDLANGATHYLEGNTICSGGGIDIKCSGGTPTGSDNIYTTSSGCNPPKLTTCT